MKRVYFEDLYRISGWSFVGAIIFLILLPWFGIFAKVPSAILLVIYLVYSKRTLNAYLPRANPSWQARNDISFEQIAQVVSGIFAVVLTLAVNLDPGPSNSVWAGVVISGLMAIASWCLGETALKSAGSCGTFTSNARKSQPKSFRDEVIHPDGTAR